MRRFHSWIKKIERS